MVATSPVTLPDDALSQLLHMDVVNELLDPHGRVQGAQDWPMRRAEAFETIEIVVESIGRRFASRDAADQWMFKNASGGGFGIRDHLRDAVLGLLRSAARSLDELAALVPGRLLDQPGTVFNAGRTAFAEASPIYLLGINPGGDPADLTHGLIRENIDETLSRPEPNWSAYRDKSWGGKAPGTERMQVRVLHLLDQLGLDPGTVPASNVVFARSRKASDLGRYEQDRLEEECWPFHEAVIRGLGIHVVVCFGQDTGRLVKRKVAAHEEWGTFTESNDRESVSRGFVSADGINVVVVTHPSRTDWRNPAADVSPLVEEALSR